MIKFSALILILTFIFGSGLAACSQDSENPTPVITAKATQAVPIVPKESVDEMPDLSVETPVKEEFRETPLPTATRLPMKEIVVCTAGPTPNLFLYGDRSPAALEVRQAIFENTYQPVGYEYKAFGLGKVPNITDGDARLNPVMVMEGDLVVDKAGKIVRFQDGVRVRGVNGETLVFDGSPVEMDQLVVDFTFKPLIWSDGTPVTAEDSVFSYQIAADPLFLRQENKIAYTANYEAIDDLTVRWTGLPGFIDQSYATNVWDPLPRHQLGNLRPEDLLNDEKTSRYPLSTGPYIVSEWQDDGSLILEKNPNYYRGEENLPVIDRIIIYFGNGEFFLAGGSENPCDIITNSALGIGNLPLLKTAAEQDDWKIITAPGNIYEQIAFGINPVPEYSERRPDWFEDARVRQAITMCTDRQRMIDEITDGYSEILHAYVPQEHPLFSQEIMEWPYDPQQANDLLNDVGFLDISGDGRRQDLKTGIPMTVTIGTNNESQLRININDIFQENMATCGIPVETYELPAGTWFSDGPLGKVFGREFDLATLAWVGHVEPGCELYLTENISGSEEDGFGGWGSSNVTGWSNDEFDVACSAALTALPGGEGYLDFQREALRIFSFELPAIPLFTNVRVAAVRPEVENVSLDGSQRSIFWNVYEWDKEK